jgi:hypothetical protein
MPLPRVSFGQNRPDVSTTFNVALNQLCNIPMNSFNNKCMFTMRIDVLTKTLPTPSPSRKLRQYVPLKH